VARRQQAKIPTTNMGNFQLVVIQSWKTLAHGFRRNIQAFQKGILASSMGTQL
jgi:hypothetical protein